MPKDKPSISTKLNQYVLQYTDLKTDGKILFCKICNKSVTADKIFTVKQHLQSTKHIQLKANRVTKKQTQQLIGESSALSIDDQFGEDLCSTFIAADIPLYKIRHDKIKSFLEKYTDHRVPSESNLRSIHVTNLYKASIEKVKHCIQNKYLWISIDETTDAVGRYIANVIIGILHSVERISKQKFLLNTASLDAVNHSSIARLFDDSIKILGENFDRDLILLFITDAAPYMIKAAHAIQIFYPKVTHLTCLVHGLHRVCEKIRCHYPKVDRLISNIKKVFLKAPSRMHIFKTLQPELKMPPRPIITRWATWINAVNYYANNFENISLVFDTLNSEEAASIQIVKDLLQDNTIKMDIIFISSNYGHLVDSITQLESYGKRLSEQIKIVTNAVNLIEQVHAKEAVAVKEKLVNVIKKNTGFSILQNISSMLTGLPVINEVNEKYTIDETLAFKFAPITSVDVERTFSMYKNVLRSNRQSFLFENLKEIFVIYCNNNFNHD